MIKTFLKALRLPFLAGAIIPITTAAAFAFHRGSFSLIPLDLPFLVISSLAAFFLARRAIQILWRGYLSFQDIIPAQALTIQTLISMGLLTSGPLFISRIIGA